MLAQEKLLSLGDIQQKFNVSNEFFSNIRNLEQEALELRDLEDPKDKVIEEMKHEKMALKASNKQLKSPLIVVFEAEITEKR